MALLERDQGDELTRNHQRQRIAVEALGREKLDELNEWVAGQLHVFTHLVHRPYVLQRLLKQVLEFEIRLSIR